MKVSQEHAAAGLADDLAHGLEAAAASIDDGRAAAPLERMVKVSREHVAPAG